MMFKIVVLAVLLCASSVLSREPKDPIDELHDFLAAVDIRRRPFDAPKTFRIVGTLNEAGLTNQIANGGTDDESLERFIGNWN